MPKYDFNWQHSYELAEPKLMPKGTTLEVVAHLRQLDGQPLQPRSDGHRALGRSDVGRDDDRLLLDHRPEREREDDEPAIASIALAAPRSASAEASLTNGHDTR